MPDDFDELAYLRRRLADYDEAARVRALRHERANPVRSSLGRLDSSGMGEGPPCTCLPHELIRTERGEELHALRCPWRPQEKLD